MQDQKTIFSLALLSRMPNVREDELIKALTDSLYLDFFQAKQALAQLLDRELITLAEKKAETEVDSSGRAVQRYNIKPEGTAVLELLYADLPENMRGYLEQIEGRVRQERMSNSKALIEEIDGQRFRLKLEAREGRETIFSLELILPSRALAEKIKADWNKDPAALYQSILLSLCETE